MLTTSRRESVTPLPDMSNWLGSQRSDGDPNGIDCVPDFDASLGTNGSITELSYSLGLTSNQHVHIRQQPLSHTDNMVASLVQYVNSGGNVDMLPSSAREQLMMTNRSMTTSEWLNQITSLTSNSMSSQKFQHLLLVGTSPVTRRNEETLTYLNQGQSYEIKLKKMNGSNGDDLYKSIVRVVFHERRLQYIEREQLDLWRQTRPGERIVDIDVPLSYGLLDVKIDPRYLNCIEVMWNANKDSSLFIKVHCISTEFTQHKHGGEKGVPFRIQVETYAVTNTGPHDDSQLVHCASCQIKVFKPKGADRKHKRDMEKIMKTSDLEKAKYQPVYPCTLLTEIPIDQVMSYLVQLRKHHEEMAKQCNDDVAHASASCVAADIRSGSASLHDCFTESPMSNSGYSFGKFKDQAYCQRQLSFESRDSMTTAAPQSHPKNTLPPELMLRSQLNEASYQDDYDELLPDHDCNKVIDWLTRYRFTNYIKVFKNYSGSDLLSLSRSDLVELCGLSNGIRLNNALQARGIRPKLTIYVCRDQQSNKVPTSTSESKTKFLPWNVENFLGSSSNSSRSDSPVETINSPSPFYRGNTETGTLSSTSSQQTLLRAMSMGSFQQPLAPFNAGVTNHRSYHQHHRIPSGIYSAPNVAVGTKRLSNARDALCEDLSSTKRPRTRDLESTDEEVYSAIYLEYLTRHNLIYKLTTELGLDSDQISQILIQGPSNIRVLVTDSVVQNLVDQSRYSLQLITDTRQPEHYCLLMKSTSMR